MFFDISEINKLSNNVQKENPYETKAFKGVRVLGERDLNVQSPKSQDQKFYQELF